MLQLRYPDKIGWFEKKEQDAEEVEYCLSYSIEKKLGYMYTALIIEQDCGIALDIEKWDGWKKTQNVMNMTYLSEEECLEGFVKWCGEIQRKLQIKLLLREG